MWRQFSLGKGAGRLHFLKLLPFEERPVSFHTEEKPQGSESITLEKTRTCDSPKAAQEMKENLSGNNYQEVNIKVVL